MSDLIDELAWRGLIAQHTDMEALRAALQAGPVTFYCGFDPTAPSLHHGHLVQLIMMRHLQLAGHKPLALVGGATGLIGDPRMTKERQLHDKETVAGWVEKLKGQISQFLDFEGPNAARLVNNLDWTQGLSAINLLRDLGKNFRMGTMLNKDAVKSRLNSEEGISYTEFSYQILQANDFLQLYRNYGCTLETGGNDQWGNLVGGMDLIHKLEGANVHVMTTPLITKADGTKFGKSEGGAIWLNPQMMSPSEFYQFWLNTEDSMVVKLLKVFLGSGPHRRTGSAGQRSTASARGAKDPGFRSHQAGARPGTDRKSHRHFSGPVWARGTARFGRGYLACCGKDLARTGGGNCAGAKHRRGFVGAIWDRERLWSRAAHGERRRGLHQ